MKFGIIGYGTGSLENSAVAKQYRKLRVKLDIVQSLNVSRGVSIKMNKEGLDGRSSSVILRGVTQKTSGNSVDNFCAVQFTDGSAAENILIASMFLEAAADGYEVNRDFFEKYGKNLSSYQEIDSDKINISMRALQKQLDRISKLLSSPREPV